MIITVELHCGSRIFSACAVLTLNGNFCVVQPNSVCRTVAGGVTAGEGTWGALSGKHWMLNTKGIPFSPPWQISDLGTPDQPRATELDACAYVARCAQLPIVIAEDDLVCRTLMSNLMAKWGFKAVVAQDGHEAMKALRAEQGPALAILDWMMPDMDGLQVCRRIRESEKMLYVIMLTARGTKENIVEGLHAGADDYLIKPFDNNELLARIQVGLRILELHGTLAARVKELEEAATEIGKLKLRIPL